MRDRLIYSYLVEQLFCILNEVPRMKCELTGTLDGCLGWSDAGRNEKHTWHLIDQVGLADGADHLPAQTYGTNIVILVGTTPCCGGGSESFSY